MTGIEDIKIGDVYVCSWGYEQTNVNFYQVVEKTPKMVRVKPIRSRIKQEGNLCGYATPLKDKFKTSYDPFVKGEKLCKVHDDGWITLKEGYSAHKWDGEPVFESWWY